MNTENAQQTLTVAEQKEILMQIMVDAGLKFGKGIHAEPMSYINRVTIQHVKEPRKGSWSNEVQGLVVRVNTVGYFSGYAAAKRWFEEFFAANSDKIQVRLKTESEKLRKGSGYHTARGGYEYATVEHRTISFWVTLK